MSRLLASLVWLYPPGFRQRFGAEVAAVLRESLRAVRPAPVGERLARNTIVVADLLAGAGAEWWSQMAAAAPGSPRPPAWSRLRSASPQSTAAPEPPPFAALPELRRRHAGRGLPPRAPSMT